MSRPIVLGVVGDSGAGKTTLTRGLVRVLGDGNVAHLSADDYHRYDRHERRGLGITPLHPDANYLDILTQHLGHLRRGQPVLKPVYDHRKGDARAPALPASGEVPRRRGAAELPHRDAAHRPRRARVPRPARGAAPRVEGEAGLHAARLHDRPGAVGARPPRARRRGVHPPAAGVRRHRRELPPASWRRSRAPRRRGRAARHAPAPRPRTARRRHGRRARRSSAASASCCCGSRATSRPTTPPCSRRRCGTG